MFSLFKYQRKRWFWKLRYCLITSIFYLNKFFFKRKESVRIVKERFSITKELVKSVILSILLAFTLVVALELLEKALIFIITISNKPFFVNLAEGLRILYTNITNNSRTLITLFSIIASVSGIFLGLYFTAVSVVASSMFARVPDNLRDLLLKEKVGNLYIKILAMLTAVSVILIGYKSFGGQPGLITILFVIILGCFGIFCFVSLGVRAFFFFDPTKLGDAIFYDLFNDIRLATINGFNFLDVNFQAHYQKFASRNIATLKTLIDICVKESHLQKRSLPTVLQKTVYFMETYESQRSYIPSDSRWFALMPRHKNWFLSDSTALSFAMETHTSIQPEMIPNPYWFEDEVYEILISSLENAKKEDNLELIYNTINALNSYFEKMGHDLESKKSREMLNKVGTIFDSYFYSLSPKEELESYEDIQLALFDTCILSFMSYPLGFHKLARKLKAKIILGQIDRIDWLSDKDIYRKGFPPPLLPRVEFVQRRLKVEKAIEGKIISPNWYKRQLIIMRYVELFKDSLDELLDSLETIFISKSNTLLDKKLSILAAVFSQRGLETCNKMRAHLPYLKSLIEDLEKMVVVSKDLTWSKIDWDNIKDKINEKHDKLTEIQAKCLPTLSLIKKTERQPDIFGQTYNTICHETYYALASKNREKFKILFPLLFFGSLMAHENLKTVLKDYQIETVVSISSEPLLDIMQLSGYAKIYSELYDIKEMWDMCGSLWDKYFDKNQKKKETVELLIKLQQYRRDRFQLFPRDILRTNWEIHLNKILREMNLIDDMLGSRMPWDKTSIAHKSPFIRAFCRGRYEPHVSAAEVFILTYLLKRPESKGISFEDRSRLNTAIKEEEKKGKEVP